MEPEAAELSEVSTNTNSSMSSAEEPSQENSQKVPEIRLQEDEATDGCDPEDPEDPEDKETNDLLKTGQRDKSSISPLSLFKEDFSQFKEEIWNVFRDTSAENKPAASTLDLLKEDLSQFREDVTGVFKPTDPKTGQSVEKTINRLSFLSFRDDLSNVFRIGPSKERVNKEDSSNTVKTRADGPFLQSLFRKTSQKTENSQKVKETFSETSEQHTDAEQSGETVDAGKINDNVKDGTNEVEDSEEDKTVSEEKTETTTSLCETQQCEETIPSSQTDFAEQRRESEESRDDCSVASAEDEGKNKEEQEAEEEKEAEEEEEPSEAVPWEPLSSGINLFGLRNPNTEDLRTRPGGDPWSVKNFACYLTFDPNTANSELHLTDGNRKATRVWSDHRAPDHPDRFQRCPQVLCREGLLDSAYWEVEWSGGGADIGITYNNISRDGDAASCLLGHNERSWSLECSEGSYTPCHRNKRFRSSSPRPFTRRVGVHLNWAEGSLSFYCVSQDAMVHLHTFTSSFSEPLYPGFWVWGYGGSVALSQVQLDWERLLQ